MKIKELPYKTILAIITSFYKIATHDPMIGFHFRHIKDFDEHIPRIAHFWNFQLNGKVKEKVSPPFDLISAHKPLGVKKAQIDRWVVLFKKNLSDFETSENKDQFNTWLNNCLLYTSPSPRDATLSRMPSSA